MNYSSTEIFSKPADDREAAWKEIKRLDDIRLDRLQKKIHVPNEVPEFVPPSPPPAVDPNSVLGRLRVVVEQNLADKSRVFGGRERAEAAVKVASHAVLCDPTEENVAKFVEARRSLADADFAAEVFEPIKRAYQARLMARTRQPLIDVLRERLDALELKKENFLRAFAAIVEPAGSETHAEQEKHNSKTLAGLNAQIKSTAGTLRRLESPAANYQDVCSGLQNFKEQL